MKIVFVTLTYVGTKSFHCYLCRKCYNNDHVEMQKRLQLLGHSSVEIESLSSFAATKLITPRFDLQIRSGISILSALQIDNARGMMRDRFAEEKTFMRPANPAWLLTLSTLTL